MSHKSEQCCLTCHWPQGRAFICHDKLSLWFVSFPAVLFPERGFKPVTNFKRNLTALSSWYSIYTSAIAFIVSPHHIQMKKQSLCFCSLLLINCVNTHSLNNSLLCVCVFCANVGLHVCSVARLGHPHVPVPRHPPAVLKLPHCQVSECPAHSLSAYHTARKRNWILFSGESFDTL